jgi:hypothetical protein
MRYIERAKELSTVKSCHVRVGFLLQSRAGVFAH